MIRRVYRRSSPQQFANELVGVPRAVTSTVQGRPGASPRCPCRCVPLEQQACHLGFLDTAGFVEESTVVASAHRVHVQAVVQMVLYLRQVTPANGPVVWKTFAIGVCGAQNLPG